MGAKTPAERLAEALNAPVAEVDARRLAPMLCAADESNRAILSQPGWLYELKLDGVRIVADKRGDKISLGYRKLRDATDNYPEVATAIRALPEERVVLDGEIVAFDEHGRPDFQLLSQRIQYAGKDALGHAVRVVYVVFDVLAIGDRDLRPVPLESRKAVLERVITEDAMKSGHLRLHPTLDKGEPLMEFCRAHKLEGVVAKKSGSPYRQGARTSDWVKIKENLDAEFVIVGWTEGEGTRSSLGSLDVATYEGDRLVVRGAVGSGLNHDTIMYLLRQFQTMLVDKPVAEGRYNVKPTKRRHVRPEIVISVQYHGFSHEGVLRFPVFRGIRTDVDPRDCTAKPDPR
jgi:bifunctional non-homologous end joining protein LigD